MTLEEVVISYDIFLADQKIGNTVILPKVKNEIEDDIVQLLT